MSEPTFSGEVQFAGYSDSSRSGPRVTLRLAERADLERFVGCEGKRFMAVLVEIGPDEQPVPEDKPKGGERAKWCALRCQEPEFQQFLRRSFPLAWSHGMGDTDVHRAASVIRAVCLIGSRVELDNDPVSAARFDKLIRMPWMEREKT